MEEERPQVVLGDVLLWLREMDLGDGIGSEYSFWEALERASQKIQDFRDGLDFPVVPRFVDERFRPRVEQFRKDAEEMITEICKRSALRDEFHTFLIAVAAGDIPGNNPDRRIEALTRSWNLLTEDVMHNGKDFRPFLIEYLGCALLKVSEGCLVFKFDNSNSDKTRHVLKRFMAEHGDSSFIKKFQNELTSNVVQLIKKELEEHENISDIMELVAELKKYTQVLVIGRVKDLSPAATSCSVMVALPHEFDWKNDLKKVETETLVDMALQSSTLKLDKERAYDMFRAARRCKSSSLEHIRRLLNELEKRDKDEAAAASETMKPGEASAPASKPGPSGTTMEQPEEVRDEDETHFISFPQPPVRRRRITLQRKLHERSEEVRDEDETHFIELYYQPLARQRSVTLPRQLHELEDRDEDEAAEALETMKLGEASAPASKPGPSGTTVNQPVGVIKPSEVLNIEYGCLAIAHLPSGQLVHGGTYGLVGLDFIPDFDNSTPIIRFLTVHADRVYVLHDGKSTYQLSVINLSTKQTQTFDANTKYDYRSCVAVSDTKIYIFDPKRSLVKVHRLDTFKRQYDIPLPDCPTCLTVLPDDTLLVGFYSKVVRVRGDKSEYTELWRSGYCFDGFGLISIVYDDQLDVMLCLAIGGRLYQLDFKGSVLSCALPDRRYIYRPVMDLNGDDLYISLDEKEIFKYNIQEIRSTFTQPSIEDSSVESD